MNLAQINQNSQINVQNLVTQNLTNNNLEETLKVAEESGLSLTDSNLISQKLYQNNIYNETENIKNLNDSISVEQVRTQKLDSISQQIDSILDTYSSSGASIYDPDYRFLSHSELKDFMTSAIEKVETLNSENKSTAIDTSEIFQEIKQFNNSENISKESFQKVSQLIEDFKSNINENIKDNILKINDNLLKISEHLSSKEEQNHSDAIYQKLEEINHEKKEELNSQKIASAHEPTILTQQLSNLLL
jgi:hypothetical protein